MPEVPRTLLEAGRAAGVFPAAQCVVRAPDRTVAIAVGRTSTLGPSTPVTLATRFDVASLTKPLCTSVLLMQAVEGRAVRLDDRVARWLPELPGADRMTLADVAMHRAGFAAHRPLYRVLWDEGVEPGPAARVRLRELVAEEGVQAVPGTETCYSDLGYIVLGWIVEAALGAPLEVLFDARIREPLGLERSSFGPVEPTDVAATELDASGEPLRGVVHDENARALGGSCGHAGLFSTALEVEQVVSHLDAVYRGERGGVVAPETVQRFWAATGERFTLGWDTPTEPSSSGRYTTRGASVGHLGYTGCSVWHDLARQVTIVLLTNRVHPSSDNDAIKAFRPRFHDAVNEWLGTR